MSEGIQRIELATTDSLIQWLGVLNAGYAKPDQSASGGTGTVRETKHFLPFIFKINKELCRRMNLECPDVPEELSDFKVGRPRITR